MAIQRRPRPSSSPNTPPVAPSGASKKFPPSELSETQVQISASTDDLKRAGQELAETFKLIEAAWAKAEAQLALAHVPVDVKVQVGSYESEYSPDTISYYLGYVKLRSGWRICYISDAWFYRGDQEEQEYDCRPITEVPVETRIEMFDRFPELFAEVLKVTKAYVPKIKESVAKFESSLTILDL